MADTACRKLMFAALLATMAWLHAPVCAAGAAGGQADPSVSDAGPPPAVPADLGERLAAFYARPAVARLRQAARDLAGSVRAFCASAGNAAGAARAEADPDADAGAGAGAGPAREALARDFRAAVLAWAGLEFMRFGPLVEANRYERIAFWPDPRGVMPRQVQALLAERGQAEPLTPEALAGRSVALQGLPALEFVLYRPQGLLAETGGPAPADCAYAQAAAGALAAVAGELEQAWSPAAGFGRDIARPGPGNAHYRSQREVAAEAVKALSGSLQFARDVKLLPVLQASGRNAGRRAPFWRSGLTAASMAASLQGMLAFHDAAGWRFDGAHAWIGESLRHELAQLGQVLGGVSDRTVDELLQDEAGRRRLELAVLILKNAKDLVDQDLAPYLGIALGFNALDGD